jgi:hypothetical protein
VSIKLVINSSYSRFLRENYKRGKKANFNNKLFSVMKQAYKVLLLLGLVATAIAAGPLTKKLG